ncbi:MAG TPA: hypothetical protein VF798_03580 [Burkholderiaceae bacterium]
MQFIDDAPLFRVVRITGPEHNLLGIQFSAMPLDGPPAVEALDADSGELKELQAEDVAIQVRQGLALAAKEFGHEYHVEKIQFVTTDSMPATIYCALALELVRRMEQVSQVA